MENSLEWFNKYRPVNFAEIIGHTSIKKVFTNLYKDEHPNLLFTGNSGVGKTTFAKIIANKIAGAFGTYEFDAASHSGVTEIKELILQLSNPAIIGNGKIVLILDECHRLSSAAWQSLLKVVEEPPAHLYFIFCTTEAAKVPTTIKSRCRVFTLKPLKNEEIKIILENIIKKENLIINDEIVLKILQSCENNARTAITLLSLAKNCETINEFNDLILSTHQDFIIDFCRKLVNRKVRSADIKSFKNSSNFEEIRRTIFGYLTACAVTNVDFNKDLDYFLNMANHFRSVKAWDSYAEFAFAVCACLQTQ